jgi:hypothetical protein
MPVPLVAGMKIAHTKALNATTVSQMHAVTHVKVILAEGKKMDIEIVERDTANHRIRIRCEDGIELWLPDYVKLETNEYGTVTDKTGDLHV